MRQHAATTAPRLRAPLPPPTGDEPCHSPGARPQMWTSATDHERDQAQQACRTCPAVEACLAWALDHPDSAGDGVWGATTAAHRAQLTRRHHPPRPPSLPPAPSERAQIVARLLDGHSAPDIHLAHPTVSLGTIVAIAATLPPPRPPPSQEPEPADRGLLGALHWGERHHLPRVRALAATVWDTLNALAAERAEEHQALAEARRLQSRIRRWARQRGYHLHSHEPLPRGVLKEWAAAHHLSPHADAAA